MDVRELRHDRSVALVRVSDGKQRRARHIRSITAKLDVCHTRDRTHASEPRGTLLGEAGTRHGGWSDARVHTLVAESREERDLRAVEWSAAVARRIYERLAV